MAVYTRIDEKDLNAKLAAFDIGALESFDGIAEGIENSNYLLKTGKGRFVLTLFEKRVNPEELPFYLDYMRHLSRQGIPCPAVAADRAGGQVFSLSGKPAIISSFLDGAWPREITPAHCAALGAMIARMHLAAQDYKNKRHNDLGLPAWKSLIHACAREADTLESGLFDALEKEMDYLRAEKPRTMPSGVVHADIFPDNVFFKNGKISGIIDFYFSCWDFFIYDLMLALNPWCFSKDGVLDREKSAALLSAYHAVRPLSAAEIRHLPMMGRAAAMRIIATRLYDWFNPVEGALVTPKDPMEHVRILRAHQAIGDAAAYGFAP